MTELEKVIRILTEVRYLSLATLGDNSQPWISTIFYAYNKNLDFIWMSKKDTRHSQNIEKNPSVALNMYWVGPGHDNVDALYIEAQAQEITGLRATIASLSTYTQRLLQQKFFNSSEAKKFLAHPEDFLKEAPFRLYKASPTAVYKFVQLENWKDKLVDGRLAIPVPEIIKLI
ncbi:MAG: pyridoxamine 5'-phosphate oxidase family protein [Candidatus Dojkabacteria bacterium]|nr:MAG: pyridoxamine 5'-phosphate oxidase family protein [Candidatus Dojkabacteria bacterium]